MAVKYKLTNGVLGFLCVITFLTEAKQVSVDLKFSDAGYWYAKACNGDPLFCQKAILDAFSDIQSFDNSAELYCFFDQTLRSDHPVLKRLNFWNRVKENKLRIPSNDVVSIQQDIKILQNQFNKHMYLFDKIASFYGISKKIKLKVFYSRPDPQFHHAIGVNLNSFLYKNEVLALCLICEPPITDKNLSIASRIGIAAHEFSHSMLEVAYGSKEKFESMIREIGGRNAKIVSYILNEALAAVLGNIIVQEKISKKNINWGKEEYCTYGFANALKPITAKYLKLNRTMDFSYIQEAVRIFNNFFPNNERFSTRLA